MEFGDITRVVPEGTETTYLLKVTDEDDREFAFVIGDPADFQEETLEELGKIFEKFWNGLHPNVG